MILQHIALWTRQLEEMKDFYQKYFGGKPNEKYESDKEFNAHFSSYFLEFDGGAQLEIMKMDTIADGINAGGHESIGLTHIAFSVDDPKQVDELVEKLKIKGYTIAGGPRRTGDDYYEAVVLDPDGNRVEIVVPPQV